MNQDSSSKMYHVEITPEVPQPPSRRREWAYDLTFEELERRFLTQYRRAQPIVINGRTLPMDAIVRVRIYETEIKIQNMATKPRNLMKDVTSSLIVRPYGWELEDEGSPNQELRPSTDAREVFVVHGRNNAAQEALYEFLRSIDLYPLAWSEAVRLTGRPSPYIGEVLDAAFSNAHAVVVLFTPDDEARLREPLRGDTEPPHETELTGQARPNVLFEAGMAMGRSEDRTVLVELGTLRPFSDVAGRHVIRLDNSTQRRQELAQRLEAAGCPVKLTGPGWHTAGDFMAAISSLEEVPLLPDLVEARHPPLTDALRLSDDALELLAEAAKSRRGMITKVRMMGGMSITANGKSFCEMGSVRSEARWEQAIGELHQEGFVIDRSGNDQVFEVTHKGFEIANRIETTE